MYMPNWLGGLAAWISLISSVITIVVVVPSILKWLRQRRKKLHLWLLLVLFVSQLGAFSYAIWMMVVNHDGMAGLVFFVLGWVLLVSLVVLLFRLKRSLNPAGVRGVK